VSSPCLPGVFARLRIPTCLAGWVEHNDVVIVEPAEIDALSPEVRRVYVKPSDLSIISIDCAVALSSSISNTRIRFPFAFLSDLETRKAVNFS
jgi:hypothetical protein